MVREYMPFEPREHDTMSRRFLGAVLGAVGMPVALLLFTTSASTRARIGGAIGAALIGAAIGVLFHLVRRQTSSPVTSPVEKAKYIISANVTYSYGLFRHVCDSGLFPPHAMMNEFLMIGHFPEDQDGLTGKWRPFTLSTEEYDKVKEWWVIEHPGSVEDGLGQRDWSSWIGEILER